MKSYHVTRQWFNKIRARWNGSEEELAALRQENERLNETLAEVRESRDGYFYGWEKEQQVSKDLYVRLHAALRSLVDIEGFTRFINRSELTAHVVSCRSREIRVATNNRMDLLCKDVSVDLKHGATVVRMTDDFLRHSQGSDFLLTAFSGIARALGIHTARQVEEAVMAEYPKFVKAVAA